VICVGANGQLKRKYKTAPRAQRPQCLLEGVLNQRKKEKRKSKEVLKKPGVKSDTTVVTYVLYERQQTAIYLTPGGGED